MTILCKELWIRFKDQNKHGQRIVNSDYSGAAQLAVTANEQFVCVTYLAVNKNNPALPGAPLKVICFNKEAVHEFSCEDSLSIADETLNKVSE